MLNLFAIKGLNNGVNGPVSFGVSGGVDGYAPSVDTTPDSLTFPNGSAYDFQNGTGSNAYAQVTGIAAAATLCPVYDTQLGVLKYRVTSSTIDSTDFSVNAGLYTNIASGGTFSVSNNQWVGFMFVNSYFDSLIVFIKNQNSSGTTLGSFIADVYAEPF